MKTFSFPALILLLLAAGLAPAAAQNRQHADFIWIEGESAARHNFPPVDQNPFRPQAFWESDLLSGGQWIGTLWREGEPQPFLEFDIEVPEAGTYSLYVRKFYTNGNFRWRLGDGPWHEPPSRLLHTPLDHVAMREEGERITLNWFYMGECELAAGRQTLRIEPVRGRTLARTTIGVGTPLAFDAFVLTRGLFFPTGKIKPGERHPVRDAEGFAFQPGIDSFDPAALDLRELNERFAGARGGITVRDGRLVFRDNNEEVRLLGVNFEAWHQVSTTALEHMARSLAKRGINFVRMDFGKAVEFVAHGDGKERKLNVEFHEPALAYLAQIISILKNQGIYTALTWNIETCVSLRALYDPESIPNRPSPSDPQTSELYENSMPASLAALRIFDPDVRQACLQAWERILGLQLQDGSTLGKDPALLLLTLSQQSSLLEENALPWEKLPPHATAAALDQWQKWLTARHGSAEKALAAWSTTNAANDVERPPDIRTILARRDAWAQDALRFLVDVQRQDYDGLVKHFRGLGYSGLISASNQSVNPPELLSLAEMVSRMPGDIIERHGKLLSDFAPKYDIWNFTEGALYGERSPAALTPLQGEELETARFDLPFKAPAFPGRPSFLTEIGIALPNRYSGEFPLATLTLAALQDVQAVAFSSLSSENWQGSLSSSRIQIFTPAMLGQMPALAYAYRKGLLPGPVLAGHLHLPDDTIYSLQPLPFHEAPDTQLNAPQLPPEPTKSKLNINPALWLAGKIEIRTGSKKESFKQTASDALLQDGSIQTAQGRIRWNPEARLLVVDAPSFQAACGALHTASPLRLGDIEIESNMETGSICVVALDGQPLAFSKRILVQAFSEEFNTGFNAARAGNFSVVRSPGRPPLLIKPVQGTITLLRPDADQLFSTALDAHGSPILPANLGPNLRLLPSTTHYLIEK